MYAEVMAVLVGIQRAIQLSINNLWIEMDSLVMVNMLQGKSQPPWSVSYIVKYKLQLLEFFQQVHVSHIFREGKFHG